MKTNLYYYANYFYANSRKVNINILQKIMSK